MLNSGPSIEIKMYHFRLNPFYNELDTCSTFKQNINKNTVYDIWKFVQGIKSHSNRVVRRTNHNENYGGFL